MKCTRRARRTTAFTLVELLIVVAVIGTLVALLLPAVQAAREAARRLQCTKNLSQLVIALHSYEAIHRAFPPGTIDAQGPIASRPVGYHHGWLEQVQPFLENEAVYHHADRSVSAYHGKNIPVRELELNLLSCPSDPIWGSGYSAYAGVHHDFEAAIDVDQHGILFLNSHVTRDDVRDGLAYTLAIGEKITEPGDLGWYSGTRAILRNTGEPLNAARRAMPQGTWGGWGTVPQTPLDIDSDAAYTEPLTYGMGIEPDEEAFGGMATEAEIERPLWTEETAESLFATVVSTLGPRAAPGFVGGFASYHPGGANFALADGSVRFIPNTIATDLYQHLGHRADGQLIDRP